MRATIEEQQGTQTAPRQRLASLGLAARLESLRVLWRQALLPYLCTRLLVLLVAILTDFTILSTEKPHPGKPKLTDATHFPHLLWTNWAHFDSGFYLALSIGGYPPQKPHHSFSIWEFYPLFPALIHPLGRALGGNWIAFTKAGLLVANAAALVAVAYLFVLVRQEFGERVASRAVLFLALFCSSFFLSAVYSESVFLASAIACLYYARNRRWLGAGVCGALATLARGPGVLLLLPVGWEFWQAISDQYAPMAPAVGAGRWQRTREWWSSRLWGPRLAARSARTWGEALAILLIPLAQVAFMAYAKVETGTFQANLLAIRLWHHKLTWPWQPVLHDMVFHPPGITTPWVYNPLWQSIALLALFLVFTIWAFRRLPMAYALYTLGMFLVPLCTGYITSLARYYLVIFPAFILLALWCDPEKHLHRYSLVLAGSAAWLTMLTAFFVLGYPSSGA
jgi:hypothetical protein